MATLLHGMGSYEIKKANGSLWLRRKRVNGVPAVKPPYQRWLSLKRAPATSDSLLPQVVERYLKGEYARAQSSGRLVTSLKDAASIFDDLSDDDPAFHWKTMADAAMLVPPPLFKKLLADHAIPACFRWRPMGHFSGYMVDAAFEAELAIIRNCRIANDYDLATVVSPDNLPASLVEWQHVDTHGLLLRLATWSSLITFLTITNVTFGQMGLMCLFAHENIGTVPLPKWNQDWLRLKRTRSDIRRISLPDDPWTGTREEQYTYLFARHYWSQPLSQPEALSNWVIGRVSDLLPQLTDLGNFEVGSDDSASIVLSLPQDQLLTLDRVIRRTLQIQSAASDTVLDPWFFEIADLWSELWKVWNAPDDRGGGNAFRSVLFSPSRGLKLIEPLLARVPSPWGERLVQEATNVYRRLYQSIKKSMWAAPLARETGVAVGPSDQGEAIQAWDEFVANVLTDLRNTQHGYLDKRRPIQRRLLLTSGDLTPSATLLPSLWLLAFLADPRQFIGWPRQAHSA
jgi:hypothetical protein